MVEGGQWGRDVQLRSAGFQRFARRVLRRVYPLGTHVLTHTLTRRGAHPPFTHLRRAVSWGLGETPRGPPPAARRVGSTALLPRPAGALAATVMRAVWRAVGRAAAAGAAIIIEEAIALIVACVRGESRESAAGDPTLEPIFAHHVVEVFKNNSLCVPPKSRIRRGYTSVLSFSAQSQKESLHLLRERRQQRGTPTFITEANTCQYASGHRRGTGAMASSALSPLCRGGYVALAPKPNKRRQEKKSASAGFRFLRNPSVSSSSVAASSSRRYPRPAHVPACASGAAAGYRAEDRGVPLGGGVSAGGVSAGSSSLCRQRSRVVRARAAASSSDDVGGGDRRTPWTAVADDDDTYGSGEFDDGSPAAMPGAYTGGADEEVGLSLTPGGCQILVVFHTCSIFRLSSTGACD
jgi:hypothetical protein